MADDARDRFLGKASKRGVGALKGYGQASPLSEVVSGFVGAPRRFSVMDPDAREMQQARDLGEQASVAAQLYGALTPFAAGATMAKAGQMGGISPLTVYHGSPHKFKKFDASKIGTGEGAQAYGHGLYFAESPNVAKEYADVLASPRNMVSDKRGVYIEPSPITSGKYMLATKSEVGQPYGVAGDATQFIYSDHEFPNIASAIKFAKRQGLLSKNDRPRLTAIGEDRKYIPVTKASDVENPEYTQFIASDRGSIYTVDLPDEKIAQMLDWDKPLSQQPKAVKEAVNSIVLAEELYKGKYAPRFLDTKTTGGEAIEIFNSVLGSPQVTSNYLREAGIPGIQYLDQASRGAKQGTRNFVVFPGEEGALKILDVYAKGGAVHMQDGGSPLDRFTGRAPKRGASSLPGYGEGIDDPTTQALLAIRRNLGEAGRAVVGAKPYDETNPTETYRAMQALFNAPTPAAIIPEAAQAAGKAATALSGLGALGVVKPKGGNWFAGSVERGLKPLRTRTVVVGQEPADRIRVLENIIREQEAAGAVTPEYLDRNRAERARLIGGAAINNWIDTKLTKYIKNEMATPEDPVRALAERGVLHVDPETLNQYSRRFTALQREMAGFPPEGMSQSLGAQRWEDFADYLIKSDTAGSWLDPTKYGKGFVEKALETNPWLAKVDPETPVYSVDSLAHSVDYGQAGFRHLIDELRNATNPDSGLPRSLQLSPDKLQKVTVPQAVELVDKINKWRAEQKVAADLKRSQNAATVEYKAYDTIPGTTEPNQRGLRWVELRTPEITSADQLTPEAQARYKSYLSTGVGEEAALRQAAKHDKSLAESLKYEGEMMGHCVGGYCSDVESGRSRIYSLRDKKGEPHVTVEVSPRTMSPSEFYHSDLATQSLFDRLDKVDEAAINRDKRSWWEEVVRESPEYQEYLKTIPPQITQIKGKANRAPKDEYLPFVQDFVRSGQWSSVGDLQNIGMRSARDVFSEGELNMLRQAGQDVPPALSGEDIQRLHNLIVPEGQRLKYNARGQVIGSENPNYAAGGAVRMQEGGSLSQFMGTTPKRGVFSLPGYGQGAEEPAAQAALGARRNIGEFGRALVGAKPYDETSPTETYRTVQSLLNMPIPAAIIPKAAQAASKAAGALSGLGALGAISPRVTKIVEPTIDIAEIIQSPVQQTVKTAPKSIAEMTAEIIGKGELNVREPGSLSGQIPSSSASNNIQPITTVQLPTGQFATTTGFSTVKPIRTGFDVAETPEQVAHLTAGLRKSPQEQVVAVVVDKNNKPIQVIRHTVGLINQSSAEPFSLVGAIANTPGAKGFYISHNHPSGASQLSNSDERLADALLNITKDTDIQMRGMLAIGKDKFAFYDPVNKTSFQDKQIPPALRDKSIDMVERTLKKTQVLNKSAFSLPSDATAFADNFVGDQTGVVLLNNQHYPVGFMPIDATQFANLRKSGTAINILRGLERANANKAVLITKNNITPKELENIEGFFNASSVKLLDALTGPQRKSESATGRLGYNRSESFQSAIPIGVGLGAAAIQEKEYKKGGAVKPKPSEFEGMNFYDILFSR